MTSRPSPGRPSLGEFYGRQVGDPRFGEYWSGPREIVDRLADLVAIRPGHRILDVGSGIGGPARRLAERGCTVVGVDPLTRVVSEAARRGGRGVQFVAAGAPALPFRTASFDQLWSLGVVAHVADLAALAHEAHRLLRAGGSACITETFWDGSRHPGFLATAPEPWVPLTVDRLSGELRAAGFAVVEHHDWPGRWRATTDEGLNADLTDGTLFPGVVLARKASGA